MEFPIYFPIVLIGDFAATVDTVAEKNLNVLLNPFLWLAKGGCQVDPPKNLHCRRKFRSQTSDNMDRCQAEVEQKREDQRRERRCRCAKR